MGINLQKLVDSRSASYTDIVEFVSSNGNVVWKGTLSEALVAIDNYSANKFVKPVSTFNPASMAILVSPINEEIEQEPKAEADGYNLTDKNKVLNAIKYFNYTKDHEEEYAKSIINGMHKFGVGSDCIDKDNRLLKYVDSCTADLCEEGHISGTMTAEEIAKKHGVDVESINKQVERGIKVEHEHTSNDDEAKRIALDHLYELPDYYDRLDKMEEEGEKELDSEKLAEALYDELLDDVDEPLFEDLNHAEKRRWRIIKNTMKFVDFESVKGAFPQLDGKSNKEIVRQLKYMLEQLPEEKKRTLIQNHQAKELEAKTLNIGKGHKTAGNIVAGAGGGVTGAAGLGGTYLAAKGVVDGVMASTAAGASSAAAGASTAAEAVVGAATVGFAGAIGAVLIGGIIAVGGLALTALAVGATVGISKGVAAANAKKAQRRHATMMNQESIIKELKKYAKPKEDESKAVTQAKSLKLALAEGNIPGEHKCPNCGATLDAWDGTFCDNKCKEEYNAKQKKEKETLTEASSAEKKAYREGGEAENDYLQGKSIARIKDPKAREAAIAAAKAGRKDAVHMFTGDRKEEQAETAFVKKQETMSKSGYKTEE